MKAHTAVGSLALGAARYARSGLQATNAASTQAMVVVKGTEFSQNAVVCPSATICLAGGSDSSGAALVTINASNGAARLTGTDRGDVSVQRDRLPHGHRVRRRLGSRRFGFDQRIRTELWGPTITTGSAIDDAAGLPDARSLPGRWHRRRAPVFHNHPDRALPRRRRQDDDQGSGRGHRRVGARAPPAVMPRSPTTVAATYW